MMGLIHKTPQAEIGNSSVQSSIVTPTPVKINRQPASRVLIRSDSSVACVQVVTHSSSQPLQRIYTMKESSGTSYLLRRAVVIPLLHVKIVYA
jgi:hypothetical protein